MGHHGEVGVMTIKGVDTTHYNLTGKALMAAGYVFVCRYVQNFPTGTLDKEMRRAELVEKTAAGVRVVANWEWSAAPANSRSLGQADADRWLQRKAALGIPDWAPCYYSIDTAATAGSYNAYAQGWLDRLPRDQLGVYGDGALFRQLKADGFVKYAWQSMSRSFPGNHHADGSWNHDGADITQTGSSTLGGFSLDLDTALSADYGGWLLGEADPTMAVTGPEMDQIAAKVVAHRDFQALIWRVNAEIDNSATVEDGPTKGELNQLAAAIGKIPTTAVPAVPLDYDLLAGKVADLLAARLQS
jgi:hypothetical protein